MKLWIRITMVVIGMVIGHSISVPEVKAAQNYYVSEDNGNDSNAGTSKSKPFKTLKKAVETAAAGDSVYVMDTLNLSASLSVKKEIIIGRSGEATGYLIVVPKGITLTLDGDVVISGRKHAMTSKRTLLLVEPGGTLYIKGNAEVRNNLIDDVDGPGGGIVNRGNTIIDGNAKITGNVTNKSAGGGIYNAGKLTVKGGTISSNVAGNYNTTNDDILNGGGVLNQGEIIMTGGTITRNCTKTTGGGVHGTENSKLIMSGGSISSNTARIRAGGYAGVGTHVEFSGGKITGNIAAESGGLHVTRDEKNANSTSSFIMTGGEISANKAVGDSELNIAGSAGGILINKKTVLTVKGGIITENTCKNLGGGIYVGLDSTAELYENAMVTNNVADMGGGIMVRESGKLWIEEAEITANQARVGSGVYQKGTMELKGEIRFSEEDEVYLASGRYVTVLELPDIIGKQMVLVPSDYSLGRVCARAENEEKHASSFHTHFLLKEKESYILRPGNYLATTANVKNTDVVISRSYAVCYRGNAKETVRNVPKDNIGYWQESRVLSTQIPVWNSKILFQEWNTKTDGSGDTYLPGTRIYRLLSDLILYAQWKNEPPVIQAENTYAVEDEVNERVTEAFLKEAAVAEDPEEGNLSARILVENWEEIKTQLTQSYTEEEKKEKERIIRVNYRVEDCCGEEAKATASLTIFLLDETTYEKPERIRFLNEHYVDMIGKSTRWGGSKGQERLQQLFETDTADIPWESL